MEYVSSKEIALRWGVSERLVQRYYLEKRISGATKFGHYWMIPSSAEKPIKNKRIDTSKENINDTCVTGLPEWKVPGEAEHVLPKLSGDKAKIFEKHFDGTEIELNGKDIIVQFVGTFNVYNLLAVYGASLLLGQKEEEVLDRKSVV